MKFILENEATGFRKFVRKKVLKNVSIVTTLKIGYDTQNVSIYVVLRENE